MTFQMIALGQHLARAKDGNGFAGQGDWTVYKCFYGEDMTDGYYGEFFLNINERTLEAEITQKDSFYSAVLLGAFAQEMSGR